MRKLFTFLMALAIAQACFAQSTDTSGHIFKKFKVDVSVGYAIPSNSSPGSNYNGGGLFAIEPKYAVVDAFAIGLRIEGAAIVHVYNNTGGNSNNSNNSNGKANISYILTGDYYFTNTKFRPFAGAGAGIYTTASIDSNTNNSNIAGIPSTSQFGFMIRGGFELGHLRLGVEYNFVGNAANYLGLKIGVCIGGGRRKQMQ